MLLKGKHHIDVGYTEMLLIDLILFYFNQLGLIVLDFNFAVVHQCLNSIEMQVWLQQSLHPRI